MGKQEFLVHKKSMLNYVLLFFFVALGIGVQTQALQKLSVGDIVYRNKELTPQKLKQLKWLPNSRNFSYINNCKIRYN